MTAIKRRSGVAVIVALVGLSSGVIGFVTHQNASAGGMPRAVVTDKYGMDPFRRNAYDDDGWGGTGATAQCATPDQLGPANYATRRGYTKTLRVRNELRYLVATLIKITRNKYHYYLEPGTTHAFSCRRISSSRLSNHGRGLAVDLNAARNPQDNNFTSDIPPEVVQLWEAHGFDWGGYYGAPSRIDPMHFEFAENINSVPAYLRSARSIMKASADQ